MKSGLLSSLTRPFRSLAPIFQPPFDGLWLAILCYYLWCFLVYPHSQVLRGNFPDPDDYMYLVQVMDWLKGQGWYDNIQHRLNPPEGVMIHFSRLAMLPMAGMDLLFQALGLGPRGAAMLMALIYPLLLLAGFFVLMRKIAESFMPKNWAGITAYIILFSLALMYMFQPGHVDHHGLIIIVVAAAFGCAVRMMEKPGDYHWGAATGVILAGGMTIALEILPWVLVISAWLGLWATVKGRNAARHGLVFGLSLYIFSILGLLTFRPPGAFFTFDLLTYSIVYIFLTGGIAVSFAAVAIAAQSPRIVRLLAGTAMAILTGGFFFHRFPELITGPYGAMDPELVKLVLDEVNEAMPLIDRAPSYFSLGFMYLGPTLLALGAGAYFLKQAKGQKRWLWGLLTALLVTATLLTTFYQCRFAGTMGMLTIIPLAVLLQRGWGWIGTHYDGRKKVWAEIGLLLLVGPIPAVFLSALADGRSFNTGILLFPVTSNSEDLCDTYKLESLLRNPAGLGDRPRLILNDMGLGPELLYRTSHSVLAAPFLDTSGTVDAERFFSTLYPEEAEAIARRRHVELIVACTKVPALYLQSSIDSPQAPLKRDFAPHFIERLLRGRTPAWLKRITDPNVTNFVIYEVLPPKSGPQKTHQPR